MNLRVEVPGELRQISRLNHLHTKSAEKKTEGKRLPIATVGALIFNAAGEVLMIRTHKWSNLWGIPGGKIIWGESSKDALLREIKEETNLNVKSVQFALVQDCIRSREFYREEHFVLLNYTCRCMGEPDVKLNDEGREFRWVTVSVALKMPINQPTRTLLLSVQKTIRGAKG